MKLKLKSNGRVVEIHSKVYNEMSHDRKLAYQVLDKKDSDVTPTQIVVNEAKEKKQIVVNEETDDKKDSKSKKK